MINFISVPGMLVCSRFLISMFTFIDSKALLISSATVIVRHLVEPILLRYYLECVVPSQ